MKQQYSLKEFILLQDNNLSCYQPYIQITWRSVEARPGRWCLLMGFGCDQCPNSCVATTFAQWQMCTPQKHAARIWQLSKAKTQGLNAG